MQITAEMWCNLQSSLGIKNQSSISHLQSLQQKAYVKDFALDGLTDSWHDFSVQIKMYLQKLS